MPLMIPLAAPMRQAPASLVPLERVLLSHTRTSVGDIPRSGVKYSVIPGVQATGALCSLSTLRCEASLQQ